MPAYERSPTKATNLEKNMSEETVTIQDAKKHLINAKTNIESAVASITKLHDESKEGLVEVNATAEKLLAGGPNAQKIGNEVLTSLEKASAIVDLPETAVLPLQIALTSLKDGYATAVLVLNVAEQEVKTLAAELEATNKAAVAHQSLHIPRPESELYGEVEEGAGDGFPVINSPESVQSRLRFIKTSDGDVVGISVITALQTSNVVANYFYFIDYIASSEAVHKRELEIGGQDGVFIYQSTVGIAVALADALVSQFGGLDGSTYKTTEAGEQLQTFNDTLSEISEDSSDAEDWHEPAPVVDEDAEFATNDAALDEHGVSDDDLAQLDPSQSHLDTSLDSVDELVEESSDTLDDLASAFAKV